MRWTWEPHGDQHQHDRVHEGVAARRTTWALGAAIHWAVSERNVVVVVAAGNTGRRDSNNCIQNPPGRQDDSGSWDDLVTIASPTWWSQTS